MYVFIYPRSVVPSLYSSATPFKLFLKVGAGVHLHYAIYSSTENATDKKLIKIIT